MFVCRPNNREATMTTERRNIANIPQAHTQFPPRVTPELFAEMFDQFRVNRDHLDSIWDDLLRDHRGHSRSSPTAARRSSSIRIFAGLKRWASAKRSAVARV